MKDELLYERVMEEIRSRIENGELLPGRKAPSIAVIRDQFQVSSVTAVRALQELTALKYLEKRPGRGYFVAMRHSFSHQNQCIGCLLRSNYISLSDHYFNEIISGIQQAASLANADLLWSPLSYQLCQMKNTLGSELVESALEMNSRVSGFLIDERIPDPVVRNIVTATGKPAVIVNRTTELPVYSVSADFRKGLVQLFHLLRQMHYDRFIFAQGNLKTATQEMKNKIFQEIITAGKLSAEEFRILPDISIDTPENTYRKLLQLRKELMPGKPVVISSCDEGARQMISRLLEDGFKIPEDLGIVTTDGLSINFQHDPQITTLKVETTQMGQLAMELLLGCINKNTATPIQNYLLPQNFILGETI